MPRQLSLFRLVHRIKPSMPHGTWSLFHHFIQCFVTSCLLASVCAAPQLPPPAPPEPIPLLQQPYQQDFNDLATQARDVPFPPSQTSLHMGWWASQSTYSTSSGADTGGGGGLFSYGREGSAERALGALTSNQVAYVAWGVSFCLGRHHAGSKKALWALEIAYRGEQWSGGGNKSSMLIFDYSVVDKEEYYHGKKWGYYDVTPGLWLVKDSLSFASPVLGGRVRSLDGNDPANSRSIRHTLAIDGWHGDKIVQLRWIIRDRMGKDHNLAVDDLRISLVALQEYHFSHARLHDSPWFYAGISIASLAIALILVISFIFFIHKRKQNERESRDYALIAAASSTDPLLEESGAQDTSINPNFGYSGDRIGGDLSSL